MAEVTGLTATRMLAIEAESVVGGSIDGNGHLILVKHDGSTVDAGSILGTVVQASTTVPGIIEIATASLVTAGTDNTTAITPATLASVTGPISQALATVQPGDQDLTDISGLSPAAGDIMRRGASAWANQALADFITDLMASGSFVPTNLYGGSAYAVVNGAAQYIGATDPGSVANGSIWFDTSGV